jgi:anti-sigma factor RsiW
MVTAVGCTHWLHKLEGRERRLAAYAAGELPPAEQARLASAVEACPVCRCEVEAYRRATAVLRCAPRASLTAEEAAAFLPEVNRRIDQGRAIAARPVRPRLREVMWDHPRLSLASAFTALLLIIGFTLSQLQMWGLTGTTGRNGVEILSVDVDEDASVMVFQPPGTSLKVIWVFEDTST